MAATPLMICETLLRDAHQSLLATRMRTEDMLPLCEALDEIGYWSLEVWGGATFDSAIRFLGEDPWERLRALRKALPRTRLQMLLRGQNVVGYKHYPDDILEHFITLARKNGIDVFRIFDALNDLRNMEPAMRFAKAAGGHVQGTISYTISPFHTNAAFVQMGRDLRSMGADSIALKDMAGLITPYVAYDLVKALKEEVGLPVQLHTHYTSGFGTAALVKAAEAGVDVVDTAISSMSMSTSQPPTETLVAALKGQPRDTGLDLGRLADISRRMEKIRRKYASFEAGVAAVDINVLQFQVPGGMLSNLVGQLRSQGAMDKYYDVLDEIPKVRKEMGYPPLVTPSSQIVGTQATLNVVLGERYKVIPEEVKQYFRGCYGKPPAPMDPDIQKLAIGTEKPITCRPAELLEPGWEAAKKEIGDLAESDEDICSYALFPQIAKPFLARRRQGLGGKEEVAAAIAAAMFAQADAKAAKPAAGPAPAASMWKMAGRTGAQRGW
ncbi:pyruvate carboxylase subunit B [Mesoterricola silvestris]|uniref:Pyruvate carboxylase n=1 Tax=Mesoterricola silvestris TaxID=2927979 RepID=A0AA48K8F2_9BACT|nr:pyruvate carboxylase subunit B [Mesoterricola silvestris]BDU72065.1 pyruvate carboxylase [Mesoterricola silvestris]